MSPVQPLRFPGWGIAAFLLVTAALAAGGTWFYRSEEGRARARAHAELNAMGAAKAAQLAEWRRDQAFAAADLTDSPFLAAGIAEYLDGRQPLNSETIEIRLRSIQRHHAYSNVLLIDRQRRVRLALSGRGEHLASIEAAVAEAARTGRPAMTDLHRDGAADPPHITVIAPILAPIGDPPHSVVAFVALVNDASRFLDPLIQSWPTPSPSAETVLVRRDGDSVLFLNQLRHRRDTALRLRLPLTRSDLPAVMAVTGRTGAVEGKDYRGVPVVSVLLAVPESNWFVVAKVDADEVYAEWRRRAALLLLVLAAAAAGMVAVGLMARQRGEKRHYRDLLAAESALRATVERHSITLRSIGDAVIATDARARIELLNHEAARLTGWTEEEARGRPLREVFRIVTEGSRVAVDDPIERVLREGVVVELANHTLLVARDGSERPIADSGAPIRDAAGAIVGVVLVFRDQTDERRRAQAMRDGEALLLESQTIAGIGSYVLDVRGGQWASSPVLDRIFGIGPADDHSVAGWVSVIHPDDQAAMAEYFTSHVVGRRQPFDRQYRIVRKSDGALRWVHGRGRLDFDVDGSPLRMIGTIIDITDERQAELERAALQAQLLQAQKMESVGRLAGGVAHDFNNMLGAILGYADLLLERGDLPEDARADVAEIQRAAQRSAALTGQLLAFARKQTIAPRAIDLNETIEGLLKMLRRLLGEDIDLQWRPAAGLWPVHLDPSQVNQVLANLCVNARDAIAGTGHITIETERAVIDEAYSASHAGFRPGEFVRIAVTDSGAGMDRAVLDHLFEPFFTTKRQGEGTGLGLATVYGIVKQNDGFINVYSEPGHGTTFTIYFPRHSGHDTVEAAAALGEAVERGHETVLVVEDETALLRVTAVALVNLGYTVLAAASPAEATHIADTHAGPIEILLTDVVMPEMNGRDLATQLLARRPEMACVYMSGYTADVIAHRGVLEDGVLFVQKPFAVPRLAATLREALRTRRAAEL